MCRKWLFHGNKWPFYGRKCIFYAAENVLSTGCLRFVYGPSRSQATSSTNFGFTIRLDVNLPMLQCVSPSAESSTPNLHLTFRSSLLLVYGFPTGLPVVFLWYVYGMSMVCLWYVYGMSMVCLWFVYGVNLPSSEHSKKLGPIVDAKNAPSRAKNVRCPKDIYLMAEEVLG